MNIPCYPLFETLEWGHLNALQTILAKAPDGVSEFTFANLYLFRKRYEYRVSLYKDTLIISGDRQGEAFFMTPFPLPDTDILPALFAGHAYWKNIPDSVLEKQGAEIAALGIQITEDRDNFDYLYFRQDLALLSGKKYHKKRNLVNAFLLAHPVHHVKPLTADLIPAALSVLDHWREQKQDDGDYEASREALERFEELSFEGALCYINGRPAGYCLGESTADGSIFALHFEKGLDEYKGIYQFINQHFAESLDARYTYINREQDLGDEGLRQAKMTYRPAAFVRKYQGRLAV